MKASLPETTDRTRHVTRGCHKQPTLARFCIHQQFRKSCIFSGIARLRFELHALTRDAQTFKSRIHEIGFACAIAEKAPIPA